MLARSLWGPGPQGGTLVSPACPILQACLFWEVPGSGCPFGLGLLLASQLRQLLASPLTTLGLSFPICEKRMALLRGLNELICKANFISNIIIINQTQWPGIPGTSHRLMNFTDKEVAGGGGSVAQSLEADMGSTDTSALFGVLHPIISSIFSPWASAGGPLASISPKENTALECLFRPTLSLFYVLHSIGEPRSQPIISLIRCLPHARLCLGSIQMATQ